MIAAAPIPAPSAEPKSRAAADDEAAVRKAVQSWGHAWESKDMENYTASYAPGFKGSEPNAAAWQAARRVRILCKKSIDVGLSNVTIVVSPAQASATFTQSYTADTLRLVSRKTLQFELRDKRWVIVRESAA